MNRVALLLGCLLVASCRVEWATPRSAAATNSADGTAAGEVWVYTSLYTHVIQALEPELKKTLPNVTLKWFQAGSEKVTAKLEAELSAGGTQADVVMISDPFFYRRYKQAGLWLPHASINGVRSPRALVDPDAAFSANRVSTMVMIRRAESTTWPKSFEALAEQAFAGKVALGDPLTSGTAFTWAVFLERKYGDGFFGRLRANHARVAGGNAAVLQKIEGHEADFGVILLENALAAKARGSPVEVIWPEDGSVAIPGFAGILKSTRNPVAARAVVDAFLSEAIQKQIVALGDMHSVDPRLKGPRDTFDVEGLLRQAQPWSDETFERGISHGAEVKSAFSEAFAQ